MHSAALRALLLPLLLSAAALATPGPAAAAADDAAVSAATAAAPRRLLPRDRGEEGNAGPSWKHPFTWMRANSVRCTNKCYRQVGGWGPPPWGDEQRMNSCVHACQHY